MCMHAYVVSIHVQMYIGTYVCVLRGRPITHSLTHCVELNAEYSWGADQGKRAQIRKKTKHVVKHVFSNPQAPHTVVLAVCMHVHKYCRVLWRLKGPPSYLHCSWHAYSTTVKLS